MLKVIRDVGDELVVDMSRPEAQNAPFEYVLRAIRVAWPELDPTKQVFIDPVSYVRVKNDVRLKQLLSKQPLTSSLSEATPAVERADVNTEGTETVLFLFDIRIISPLFVVQPCLPQVFRLQAPIPNSPSQRLRKNTPRENAMVHVFEEDVLGAQAVAAVCQKRNEACGRYMKQFQNMQTAVDVSFSTLASRLTGLENIFSKLEVPVRQQIDALKTLVDDFPADLKAMKDIQLPDAVANHVIEKIPQLQAVKEANGVLTLIDLIPAEELGVYVKKSTDYAGSLSGEIKRLEDQISGLRRDLEPFKKKLESLEPEIQQRTDKLPGLMEVAEKEFHDISMTSADFNQDFESVKSNVPGAYFDVDETIQDHELMLSQLSQWEANSSSRYKEFCSIHTMMLNWLVNRLRMVSQYDTRVSSCFKQMKGLELSSMSLNEAVAQLQCARRMPQAYVRYEQELVRRTHFHTELEEELEKAQNSLRQMCNGEIARRKQFQMSCVKYLPRVLQDGINSLPPMIDTFKIDPFDQGLPVITEADLHTEGSLQLLSPLTVSNSQSSVEKKSSTDSSAEPNKEHV